uniref:Uncharacterized protein n=1 Tax=Trichogramma kaykai TaxID=54128 RepID=A0ABD2W9U2_9HYME
MYTNVPTRRVKLRTCTHRHFSTTYTALGIKKKQEREQHTSSLSSGIAVSIKKNKNVLTSRPLWIWETNLSRNFFEYCDYYYYHYNYCYCVRCIITIRAGFSRVIKARAFDTETASKHTHAFLSMEASPSLGASGTIRARAALLSTTTSAASASASSSLQPPGASSGDRHVVFLASGLQANSSIDAAISSNDNRTWPHHWSPHQPLFFMSQQYLRVHFSGYRPASV